MIGGNLGMKSYVAVDLGASITRFMASNSDEVRFLDNEVIFLDNADDVVDLEITSNKLEDNLDVTIKRDDFNSTGFPVYPMHIVLGKMASRLDGNRESPSSNKRKVEQRVNYASTLLAIALSKYYDSSLGDDIMLFSTLPPFEVLNLKTKFKQNLVGRYTVTFNKIKSGPKSISFNIVDIDCRAESVMAVLMFIYNDKYPDRLDTYMDGNLLSIDIGASTTDLVVFKNGEFMEKTGQTYQIGCNLASSYIRSKVKTDLGSVISIEQSDNALIEGRVRIGAVYKDIRDIVANAKRRVAAKIKDQMELYFEEIGIELTNIQHIVVSGGGSMESSYVNDAGEQIITSHPMSDYITEALADRCKGINIVYYGDEPRLANINGLGLYAYLATNPGDDE